VAAITSRTRIAVAASTSDLLFSTRDTVVLLTRARRATSAIVTRMAVTVPGSARLSIPCRPLSTPAVDSGVTTLSMGNELTKEAL